MWYVSLNDAAKGAKDTDFILTKWYVNLKTLYPTFPSTYNFILTMWYVNTAPKTYNESVTSGFILTMWYVKATKPMPPAIVASVLY